MKVEVQEINSCQKRFEVEIPLEEVNKELDALYRNLQKKVKVKGFRPGKVPRSILERLYKAEIENELISKIIPDTYTKIIQDNGIRAVGLPRLDEVRLDKEQPLRFTATVDVVPEISLKEYEGWEFTKKIVPVSEELLDSELERLRELHAQWDAIDRPAREGDYVVFNYQGSVEGKKFPELQAENVEVIIGSNTMPPELERQLIGLSSGEKKEIGLPFPPDHPNEKLAGKEALLEVQVAEVKEKRLPELNDDFAKEIQEEVETLEELKQHVRKNLEDYIANRAQALLEKEILDRLIEENPFPVPESLIEAQCQQMLNNMKTQLEARGTKLEDLDSYRERFREAAERNIKIELILDKIKQLEGVEVSEEEVDKEIKVIATRWKKSEEFVRKEMEERIRQQLVRKKTLEILIQKSRIKEEVKDTQEFLKDIGEMSEENKIAG
jgi:trigger factor